MRSYYGPVRPDPTRTDLGHDVEVWHGLYTTSLLSITVWACDNDGKRPVFPDVLITGANTVKVGFADDFADDEAYEIAVIAA